MSGELQTDKQWFDEVSPLQYKYPFAAIFRREILQNSLSGMDFHGEAFRMLGLEGGERILNVGSGDGRDETRLATDPEFNHAGEIVGLDVPDSKEPFENRFLAAQT